MAQLTFGEWVEAVFNHSKTSVLQYHEYIWYLPMDISLEKEFSYLCRVFTESKTVLAPFSDQQLAYALWYLASSGSLVEQVSNTAISWDKRKAYIQSILILFREIFNKRCEHNIEDPDNELNAACYMWWDIFPSWSNSEKPKLIDDEFLLVMKEILMLDNIACQQSALHGLGHLKRERYTEDVNKIIKYYLKKSKYSNPQLRKYAQQARKGIV